MDWYIEMDSTPDTNAEDLYFNFVDKTSIGSSRTENQDRSLIIPGHLLPQGIETFLVLADGIGRPRLGSYAAELCVSTIYEEFLKFASNRQTSEILVCDVLLDSIYKAHQKILKLRMSHHLYKGARSSCATALISNSTMFFAYVGNITIFLYRESEAKKLTVAHTWTELQFQANNLTVKEVREHPKSNLLTRSIGQKGNLEIETSRMELKPGDTVILCTNGISDHIDLRCIEKLVQKTEISFLPDELIKTAKDFGNNDDATVLVGQIKGTHAPMRF